MGKGKKSRDSVTSGGKRRNSRIMRNIRRLEYKIARWERYKAEGKPSGGKVPEGRNISKKRSPSTKSRHQNWDTTGLKKHKEHLESLL